MFDTDRIIGNVLGKRIKRDKGKNMALRTYPSINDDESFVESQRKQKKYLEPGEPYTKAIVRLPDNSKTYSVTEQHGWKGRLVRLGEYDNEEDKKQLIDEEKNRYGKKLRIQTGTGWNVYGHGGDKKV